MKVKISEYLALVTSQVKRAEDANDKDEVIRLLGAAVEALVEARLKLL